MSRYQRKSPGSCPFTRARICAGDSRTRLVAPRVRSRARARFADYLAEMVAEAGVALATPPLEPFAVDDLELAPAGRHQPLQRKLLDHRIDGRALDPEQPGEGFLGELDPVAGSVLRVEQPARRPLGDGMEGVAGDRLHHLGKQEIGEAAEQ